MNPSQSWSKWIAVLAGVICFFVSWNIHWGGNGWQSILEADARGYYAYLPAALLYQDLNYGFVDSLEGEKYYNPYVFYDYRVDIDGQQTNKYFAGTALLQAPFFGMAHALSIITDQPADGYSRWYPVFINIGALFYLVLGLWMVDRLMVSYRIRPVHRAIVLAALAFGTNLFFYAVVEPGMSHVVSFACVALFAHAVRQFFAHFHTRYLVWAGVLLGLVVLIRPVNGLIVWSIPFLAGGVDPLRRGWMVVRRGGRQVLAAIVLCGAIMSIQGWIWWSSTGHFLVDTYPQEGFNWLEPHMFDLLFSYKKGLFVYTPMYFLALLGLVALWRRSRFQVYAWVGFFLLVTYVFSSWWMWWYGGGFSSRVFVEYLPFFALLLGFSFSVISQRWLRRAWVALVFALVVVCQIQIYQYRYYHIHWSDMTKAQYWDVFLRIDELVRDLQEVDSTPLEQ